MARIAGICSTQPFEQMTHILSAMLTVSSINPEWQQKTEHSYKSFFGASHWETPLVELKNGILVAFDGYIYNGQELGLQQENNDAMIMISLYQKYGFVEAIQRINGDFAIALFDPRQDQLWLARDRFGIRPLYYTHSSEYFAFASQPKALFQLPGVTNRVNHQFVAIFASSHYRYFDNQPDQSPYADISQLPAAHVLQLTQGQVKKIRYWDLKEQPDPVASEQELAEQYRELLFNAVAMRLAVSKKPAFTLSGGMDSSSVLASATHLSGEKQHAFSSVYQDKTYDESEEIESMLETKVKKWHSILIEEEDIFPVIERMIGVHDEPVATATWLSHFLLCEETNKRGFGGLFGGLGGDELNAGEYEYFFFFFADLKRANRLHDLEQETDKWILYHDHPIFKKNTQVRDAGLSKLVDFEQPGRCLPDPQRMKRYIKTLNQEFFDLEQFTPIMDHPFSSYLKNRTYQDIFRETAPCCLRAEDRQTNKFNLDNFLPFFDYRLVEFMFTIPGQLKIREGVTKWLLREAMKDTLPEETRTRIKKVGWNAPAHRWFSGKGKSQLLDLVHSQSFRQRKIYNVEEVLRLIDEHEEIVASGKNEDNHMMFLWQLVNLELWLSKLDRHK